MAHQNILILEDHPELCAQIRQILVKAGYQVQVAATGADAVATARRHAFDLLVADIYLPDFSGIEAFQRIRTYRPDLAGIVITGYSTWEMAMDALRVGFVGFLVKPFVPEQLVAAVVSALEQEKLRRENARLNALVPLYELSRAFIGTVELNELLDRIVTTAQQETKAEVVSLMLLDEDRRELGIAAATGLAPDVIERQKRVLGSGIAGHVAETGQPVMIAEGMTLDPAIRKMLTGRSEIVSAISLPITSRGQVIGVLNLSRMRGGESFTPGDLELATVLASQAAISIDNARLFKQLRLLSDMSQWLARSMDLNEAVEAIVSGPLQLVGARGAALWLIEGEIELKMVKQQGLEDLELPKLAREQIAEGFSADRSGGWLTIPLRHGDKDLGALTIRTFTPKPPSEERLGLLRTLAHAASAIVETHRLRARESTAFREVDRAVRSNLSVRQQIEHLLEQMLNACEAECGAIFLWEPERDRLDMWVTCGRPVREDWARVIIHEGRAGFLTDEQVGAEVAMGAPMRVGGRIEGAVVLTRGAPRGRFAARQLDLLSTLTSSAALIVRNTQLYARSEEAAIAEERTRIAREIHDGLAQDLSFLVLKASAAQKLLGRGEEKQLVRELREISDQLRQDAREVRRVIFALRPLDIEALGFLPALEKFVKEFAQANDIETEFAVEGDVSHLSPKLETALFRLTQEALNNIRKHARAKHASVRLERNDGGNARLGVQDDGCGFEVEKALQAARTRGSVGLVQMRERAERAGGTFKITSSPNAGTCIEVELPVREL
ncbi:MAG: GAF domain-containing protein [Chloroflexi bacterium]|nr:GAF domain-containing protein [Chloroflexota bacterium]